jgi:tetratricopeptide (TPR) repeat protein
MNCLFRITSITALCLFFAVSVFAFGSKEKSPEEQAAENQKKATEEYNKGVQHMDKAKEVAIKGDSAFAYNYRATADAKAKKELEKAADRFTKATEIDPKMKEAFNNLGYTYRKLGKLEESLTAYDKALAIDSLFAQAREYRGETFLALGKLDQAKDEYKALRKMESPLADTLMKSIELFKLQQVAGEMDHNH